MAKQVASTQENVAIAGVKDGIVILKNGQFRLILEIAAINFALKSEEEQNSLVLQYQSFLNSIHFPVQIVIRSKRLDLAPYINKIKKLSESQKNELLKIQTEDYVDFIGQLINLANIMKKSFYMVVGYQPLNLSSGTFLDKLLKRQQDVSVKISDEEFNHNAKELIQRGQNIAQGLGSMGLHCKQLNTQGVIELFYGIYNPEIASKERLVETEKVSSTFVTTGKSDQPTPAAPETQTKTIEEATIDNREIVAQQEKQKAQERAFENQSTAQRSIGMTAAGAKPAAEATTSKTQDTSSEQNPNDLSSSRMRGSTNSRFPIESGMTQTTNQSTNPPVNQSTNNQPAPQAGGLTNSQVSKAEQKAVADPNLNKDYGW